MKKDDVKSIFKYAGAFIAWVIGSGFATGQEIFQFFSSFSYKSIGAVIINLIGFVVLGKTLLTEGYKNKSDENFNHYEYYCGKRIGKIYTLIIPVTLVFLMAVIISGSGATLNQYYGLNRYFGSVIMAFLCLIAYLIGFERMERIISSIGPVIIIFSVFVGVYTSIKDFGNFADIKNFTNELYEYRPAPNFVISSLLYVSLNFLCGSTYYTEVGRTGKSRKTLFIGAVLGAALVVLTIFVINLAILLNAGEIMELSVPTLYLAKKISSAVGGVFSVVLILGMFSSCSTMVWSFCSRFYRKDKRKNALFSIITVLVCLLLGLLPFSKLVSVLYPVIGYFGLYFVVCVAVKGLRRVNKFNKEK